MIGLKRLATVDGSDPSVLKTVGGAPDARKDAIVRYLKNGGMLVSVVMGKFTDMVSGEFVRWDYNIRVNEEYIWDDRVAYYLEKYNIEIPEDFIEKYCA